MSIEIEKTFKRSESFPWQTVEEQSLILNTEAKMAHEMNAVGSFIWNRLDGSVPLKTLIAELCSEFDVGQTEATTDVTEFVSDLLEHKLARCL